MLKVGALAGWQQDHHTARRSGHIQFIHRLSSKLSVSSTLVVHRNLSVPSRPCDPRLARFVAWPGCHSVCRYAGMISRALWATSAPLRLPKKWCDAYQRPLAVNQGFHTHTHTHTRAHTRPIMQTIDHSHARGCEGRQSHDSGLHAHADTGYRLSRRQHHAARVHNIFRSAGCDSYPESSKHGKSCNATYSARLNFDMRDLPL